MNSASARPSPRTPSRPSKASKFTLRAEQYADLDAPSVARSVSVERTLQTLVNLSAQAHPLETSTLKGAREGVDGEEQRHLTAPRFYLLDLVTSVVRDDVRASARSKVCRFDGSNGENCVAASLRDWVSCRASSRSLEYWPKRWWMSEISGIIEGGEGRQTAGTAKTTGASLHRGPCLGTAIGDCDVALFDATRPAFSLLWRGRVHPIRARPGLAPCAEGTVVCLISRDPNPTVRRAELIPTEGPSACELLYPVRTRRHGGTAGRGRTRR